MNAKEWRLSLKLDRARVSGVGVRLLALDGAMENLETSLEPGEKVGQAVERLLKLAQDHEIQREMTRVHNLAKEAALQAGTYSQIDRGYE